MRTGPNNQYCLLGQIPTLIRTNRRKTIDRNKQCVRNISAIQYHSTAIAIDHGVAACILKTWVGSIVTYLTFPSRDKRLLMAIKLEESSFVAASDAVNFTCPICQMVTNEARLLPCQHWMCQACICRLSDKRCHACRAPFTVGSIHLTLRAWLDTIPVKCLAGDCGWQGRYEHLQDHRRSCKSTQLLAESSKAKLENILLKRKTETQDQTITRQAAELTLLRARKDELEKERLQYSENLLDQLLKKRDRSRSRPAPLKREKKEKKEKPEKSDSAASVQASVVVPLDLLHSVA